MRNQEKKKYYLMQIAEIEKIKALDYKPKLLMHTCCGVCVSYVGLYLSQYFDLTLFYNNDNIYPESEYIRRYEEMVRLIDIYNQKEHTDIKIIKTDFDGENYHQLLEPLKDCPERGDRCKLCYFLRLKQTALYAKENGYDYFTSVMSISRQKDEKALNEIGARLEKEYNIKFFYADFKKDGGQDKTALQANKYNLYRQQYCGCKYSYQDYLNRLEKQTNK